MPIVPTAVGYVFYKNSSLCSAIHVTCVSSSYVVRHVLIGQCDRKCHFMSSPVVKVSGLSPLLRFKPSAINEKVVFYA